MDTPRPFDPRPAPADDLAPDRVGHDDGHDHVYDDDQTVPSRASPPTRWGDAV